MTIYATAENYTAYLQGKEAVIPAASTLYYLSLASQYVKQHTFGNVPEIVPDEVINCTCELAEFLYFGDNPSPISEKIGSYSRAFAEKPISKQSILQNWIADTGLLYSGV